jgi:hypothetical protein
MTSEEKEILERIEGKVDAIIAHLGLRQESLNDYLKGVAEGARESIAAREKRDAVDANS